MDEDQTVKTEIIGVHLAATKNIERAYSTYEASMVLGREIEEGMGKTEEEQEQAVRLWSVETFLSAFGIETALKALIRRQGREPGDIHDLYCLYKMLDSETKKRICEKAEKAEDVIKKHRKSFVDWRYGEFKKDEAGAFRDVTFGVLRDTLKAVIKTYKEKYPYEPIGSKVERMDAQDE